MESCRWNWGRARGRWGGLIEGNGHLRQGQGRGKGEDRCDRVLRLARRLQLQTAGNCHRTVMGRVTNVFFPNQDVVSKKQHYQQ